MKVGQCGGIVMYVNLYEPVIYPRSCGLALPLSFWMHQSRHVSCNTWLTCAFLTLLM